jgi:hypothetical protein
MTEGAAPSEDALFCPSARPEWRGSVAIGVVNGTAAEPAVRPFTEPRAVTADLLKLSEPVTPTEVFRFAAPCLRRGCAHYETGTCRLGERVARLLPEVVGSLPSCPIRDRCRWWSQEGAAACLRCPQVVSDNYRPSPTMVRVALPVVRA